MAGPDGWSRCPPKRLGLAVGGGGPHTRPASGEAGVCTKPAVRGAWSLYQNHWAPGPWPQTQLQAGFTPAAGQG